jgi:hypothetical protein
LPSSISDVIYYEIKKAEKKRKLEQERRAYFQLIESFYSIHNESMARPLRYQNSYRLAPKKVFNATEVEKILAKVMDDHFKELERFSEATVNICR